MTDWPSPPYCQCWYCTNTTDHKGKKIPHMLPCYRWPVKKISYFSMGELVTKFLCRRCIYKILDLGFEEITGW